VAIELLQEESGHHFEPGLVELFVENLPQVVAIKERFQDF